MDWSDKNVAFYFPALFFCCPVADQSDAPYVMTLHERRKYFCFNSREIVFPVFELILQYFFSETVHKSRVFLIHTLYIQCFKFGKSLGRGVLERFTMLEEEVSF